MRRIGLETGAALLLALLVAAFATEGLGLALIVAIGALVVAALVVPLLAMFEEERGLSRSRAAHRR